MGTDEEKKMENCGCQIVAVTKAMIISQVLIFTEFQFFMFWSKCFYKNVFIILILVNAKVCQAAERPNLPNDQTYLQYKQLKSHVTVNMHF